MKKISKPWIYPTLILVVLLITVCSCKESKTTIIASETGRFTDPRDGKIYKTVKIGEQWIMSENLAYKPDQGNYWAYDNDTNNVASYGYLYDWETAKKIAPEGWHLPTREEWSVFHKSLGGRNFHLSKNSKSITTKYEKLIAGGSSGFNALFGGKCYKNGELFEQLGKIGDFWSSTGSVDGPYLFFVAKPNSLFNNKKGIAGLKNYNNSTGGKSVRLFRD
jgi:uncharacterized protein (TIGR02145 family)